MTMRVTAGGYTTRGMVDTRYEESINNDIQLFIQAHNKIPLLKKIKLPLTRKGANQIFDQIENGPRRDIDGNNYIYSSVHVDRVRRALLRLGYNEKK
tara:strand:+ start:237 stop:527 length:291 start_codon:yes stop_codon:yes gene_type:complete